MSADGGPVSPRRSLVAAAALTVVAAVLFDVIAGEAPLHAATLGVIAAAVALLRVRLGGRHRRILQFASGCVVLQPSLHFSAKLVPHDPLEHGVGPAVGPADLLVVATQIAIALAIVAVVSFGEQVIAAVSGAVRSCRVLITVYVADTEPDRPRARIASAAESLNSRYRPGSIPRRGPPTSVLAA